ncbi:MAG TPA: hypothetical protein VKI44_39600 [Acetobacteraceae bacterium]|nr:hypothetical protein [Acetobacteraceae bacterium]
MAAKMKEEDTMHSYAIAERGDRPTWWISFPEQNGITSAVDDAAQIVAAAQDALASVAMHGGKLPSSMEDGAMPPTDLSGVRAARHARGDPVRGVGGRSRMMAAALPSFMASRKDLATVARPHAT